MQEIVTAFSDIATALEQESALKENIRDRVKELEKAIRLLLAEVNVIHSNATSAFIVEIGSKVLESAKTTIQPLLAALSSLIPQDQYYRYNNMWNITMQNACFLVALAYYYKHERLISLSEAESYLGSKISLDSTTPDFHIGIEEFLHGLLSVPPELTRLATNSVTFGDFDRPFRIQRFMGDLYTGFQLLNLKNDSLRKRFDGLKYEVKRVEEIVYDISLRGLVPKTKPSVADYNKMHE